MWIKQVLVSLLFLSLSACGGSQVVSRNQNAGVIAPPQLQQSYSVSAVNFGFAPGIEVSEANSYFPGKDIVWREDPMGDRFAQVRAIMVEALNRGISGIQGSRNVVIDVQLTRFHALTEKTRFSGLPATHDIRYNLTVRDAATGAVLEGPRLVNGKFKALTGDAAIAAMARGETQKVRIQAEMARVIRRELGRGA